MTQQPKVIYIYGLDGSGKTTICRELEEIFRKKGVQTVYRWMRFNHYASRAINAIGRLTGLAYHKTYSDGTRIGYHCYYKSSFLSTAYCLTTILDTFFSTILKIWIPLLFNRKIIILDRFICDTIIDLSIDKMSKHLIDKTNEFADQLSTKLPLDKPHIKKNEKEKRSLEDIKKRLLMRICG